MNENVVSAVFDSRAEAEQAVADLRELGADDSAISIVAQQDGETSTTDGSGSEESTGLLGRVAAGAGVGTVLGIAALAIPGVGPLAAAGAIAASAVPGAALTGAAIGAAAGGLTKLFTDHGVGEDDARYYEDRVTGGGVFVSVDTQEAGIDPTSAQDILSAAGGHSSSRQKMSMTSVDTIQ